MQNQMTRRLGRGLMVAAVAGGLAFAGATAPAHAANTGTVALNGAGAGDSATLLCNDSSDPYAYSWDMVTNAFSTTAAPNTFVFSGAPIQGLCTVHFGGGGLPNPDGSDSLPAQTIGGYLNWPNNTEGFTVFSTDPAGDYTGAFDLVPSSTLAGTVSGIADATTTFVTLYEVVTNHGTGGQDFNTAAVVQPVVAAGGFAFTFTGVSPNHPYVIKVTATGYVATWYGGAATNREDPYDPAITRLTPQPGTAAIGDIAMVTQGSYILATLAGFGQNATGGATNIVTGEYVDGVMANSVLTVSGLSEGVWLAEAFDTGGRYAYAIVATPATGATPVALTAARATWRDLGRTTTAVKGTLEIGTTIEASSNTFGAGYGISPAYEYTWITPKQILGQGAKLVVPNLQGENIFVVTKIEQAGARPGFIVSTAYGKVVLKSAPKIAFKAPVVAKKKAALKVGQKLKVNAPKTAKGWKLKYQWLRNGKAIKGKAAKKATYKLVKKDGGKKISVRITYTKQGFTAGKATTPKTKKVAKK
jgi:hypothetical protein